MAIAGGSGLRSISADDAGSVVGRTATVRLLAGSLLNPDQIADGPTLPEGTVIAGAVLKGGQYPVGLAIGDTVDVIETTTPDASGAGQPVVRGTATVIDIAEPDDGHAADVDDRGDPRRASRSGPPRGSQRSSASA